MTIHDQHCLLAQSLDGMAFTLCELDSSWLHRHPESLVRALTDPSRQKTFAVTHCAAAALLPDDFTPSPDTFSAKDVLAHLTVATCRCPACGYQWQERLVDIAARQVFPRRCSGRWLRSRQV